MIVPTPFPSIWTTPTDDNMSFLRLRIPRHPECVAAAKFSWIDSSVRDSCPAFRRFCALTCCSRDALLTRAFHHAMGRDRQDSSKSPGRRFLDEVCDREATQMWKKIPEPRSRTGNCGKRVSPPVGGSTSTPKYDNQALAVSSASTVLMTLTKTPVTSRPVLGQRTERDLRSAASLTPWVTLDVTESDDHPPDELGNPESGPKASIWELSAPPSPTLGRVV